MRVRNFIPKAMGLKQKGYVNWFELWKVYSDDCKAVCCNYAPFCHPTPTPCPHFPLPYPVRQNLGWLCLLIISYCTVPTWSGHSHSDTVEPCLETHARALLTTLYSNQKSILLWFGRHLCPSWPLPQMQTFAALFWGRGMFTQAGRWSPLCPGHHCCCEAIIHPLKKHPLWSFYHSDGPSWHHCLLMS